MVDFMNVRILVILTPKANLPTKKITYASELQ